MHLRKLRIFAHCKNRLRHLVCKWEMDIEVTRIRHGEQFDGLSKTNGRTLQSDPCLNMPNLTSWSSGVNNGPSQYQHVHYKWEPSLPLLITCPPGGRGHHYRVGRLSPGRPPLTALPGGPSPALRGAGPLWLALSYVPCYLQEKHADQFNGMGEN